MLSAPLALPLCCRMLSRASWLSVGQVGQTVPYMVSKHHLLLRAKNRHRSTILHPAGSLAIFYPYAILGVRLTRPGLFQVQTDVTGHTTVGSSAASPVPQ